MLSRAKHLCLASCRDRIQSEILRFAQNEKVVTQLDIAPSFCMFRLDLDVDRNGLADPGD
jgi:hypothetical protein